MNNYNQAYGDMYCILSTLEEEDIKKIPKKLIKFFEENRDPYYFSKIDITKPLIEQKIRKETEQIICLLNLEYLSNSEEKKRLLQKYVTNEKLWQEKLQDKYEINFSKNKTENGAINKEKKEEKSIAIIEKENLYTKLIKFFKNAFNKVSNKFRNL